MSFFEQDADASSRSGLKVDVPSLLYALTLKNVIFWILHKERIAGNLRAATEPMHKKLCQGAPDQTHQNDLTR
jgi:hypothetical protein